MASTQPMKAERQALLTTLITDTQLFDMEGEIFEASQVAAAKLQAEAQNLERRAENLQAAAKGLQARAADLQAAAARLEVAASGLQPGVTRVADTHCALLELPAEMRNKIYQYTVINEGCTTICDEQCAQPPVLRTCRQIRAEASSIFYSENKFSLEANQPLCTKGLSHVQHWLWTMPGRKEFDVWVDGRVQWESFKYWLHLILQGAIHVAKFCTEDDVDSVLNKCLSIVKDYRGLSWSVTAYQLEDFRHRKGSYPSAMCPSMLWG